MRAIRYRLSIPGYLAARAAGRWLPRLLASGWIPGLAYVTLDPMALPGPEWVRLRPLLAGICGSDLALLTGRSSAALSPFTSFPAVLGHEVVARVMETGAAVPDLAPGQRVVVDPVISCYVRGLEPCPLCRGGRPALCLRAADGPLAPGMLVGYCRDLPGGWSEEMVVHRSQLHPVPAGLPDPVAVLVEPLSVGLHAVLKLPPEPQRRVLILGAGTVGLCVLAGLRLLGLSCHVTVVARHAFQAQVARRLGADLVVGEGRQCPPAAGRSDAIVEGRREPVAGLEPVTGWGSWAGRGAGGAAVQVAGARPYRPLRGRPVYAGGFDWVYDCVGSASSLDDALRVAGPLGRVVVVGCAGEVPHLDWTFVWARELQVVGSYAYGREPSLDGAPHTFEVALRLLMERPSYPLAALVTHRFPLSRWREALWAALHRRGRRAKGDRPGQARDGDQNGQGSDGAMGTIKVVFACQADAER